MNFSGMPLWVKLWGSFGKRLIDVTVHGVDNAQIYEGFKFGDTFDSAYDSIVSSEKKNDNLTRKKLGFGRNKFVTVTNISDCFT